MAREINLVPDSKVEAIRSLKLRNLILFISIIIASASVFVSIIAFSISGGQQAAIADKKQTLESLSSKMNDFGDLGDFLTVKDQLGNLVPISENKVLASRLFGVLATLIPTGADSITISNLTINLIDDEETEGTKLTFDAQANAGQEPFIDYNVLDSFKKSLSFMRYDYGSYVDKYDNEIPSYCMIETDASGATLTDPDNGIYAYWTINEVGCNPSSDNEEASAAKYNTEDYNGQTVVKIWRTPQFQEWYRKKSGNGQPYMDLDGTIFGIEHFESKCITYKGELNGSTTTWSSSNDSCKLVPDREDAFVITDSSNGRDSSDELVLRFSATLMLDPEVFKFTNHHMLTIPPSGRINVTDSYVQVQNMFGERATDCSENDADCKNTNNGGSN